MPEQFPNYYTAYMFLKFYDPTVPGEPELLEILEKQHPEYVRKYDAEMQKLHDQKQYLSGNDVEIYLSER